MPMGIKKCNGYSKEIKPCEHIDGCDLCRVVSIVGDDEIYVCGVGVADFKCKRDNPNFKPMTKEEFLKTGKFIQEGDLWIEEFMNYAISMGLVVDE